ncbi:MAG: YihY/virulence factor BrkB family protein [Gammaproteobacteria bacterium]|nr:MAG: YihY/virulence factor BrkB family protein [Gammaproteobacteria bacterium]
MAGMSSSLSEKIDAFVWGDTLTQYGLPGRVVATVLRYLYAVLRDVMSGQLTLRSMSLVYTTLLSIVPLLAFSFSVLKGLGVHKQLESRLFVVLEPLGEQGVDITNQLMTIVNNVNGNLLGAMGLAFLIYTAISMVQKIEESFNYVWYVTKPRNFARRLAEYMLVLLIGPLFIVIAIGMITLLQNESIVQYLVQNEALGPLIAVTSKLTPYLIVGAVFTFLYMYMPNTDVKLKSALVGGLAGGFLWATVGMIFAAFVVNSTRNDAIYASFAIGIITLIWLYLNWLVLLIGSQLAFYHQNPAYLRIGRREPRLSNAMRERLALNIMFLVGKSFRDADKQIRMADLSTSLSIPSITLAPITTGLEQGGLLSLTENEVLQPGREMTRISLNDILDVVRVEGETGSHQNPTWSVEIESIGAKLDDALAQTVGEKSLSDLLDEN